MQERYKAFSSLSELDIKNEIRFSIFSEFNKFLEKSVDIKYEDIFDSYYKILPILNKKISSSEYLDYSELDFQIKFLLEENKVVVTKILDFAEIKYSTLDDLLKNFLEGSETFSFFNGLLDFNSFIETIIKVKKGTIIIQFKSLTDLENNQGFPIQFNFEKDILENFNNFKNEVNSFDMEGKKEETGMIPVGIGIM